MAEPVPFLQIVHISDLHFVHPRFPGWRIKSFARLMAKAWPGLHQLIVDGTAAHDPMAPDLFADFLDQITIRSPEPEWSTVPTCIVDTGDLTTFGDQGSFGLGWNYLKKVSSRRPLVNIYGNHDAWPQNFPLLATRQAAQTQKSWLQSTRYRVNEPSGPYSVSVPHGSGEVQLFSLDSVIHDNIFNAFAYGAIGIGNNQLTDIAHLIDSNIRKDRHDLRILIVHHPLHFSPLLPWYGMRMINSDPVARTLNSPTPAGARPMVHLVLSGHTHKPFPSLGSLPPTATACGHGSLGKDQCQLVVGSLMQVDLFGKRSYWPHQCQILRFYYLPKDPGVLIVDRLFAARALGSGPYMFVPDSTGSNVLEEEITFVV